MTVVATPAVVLHSFKYSESSKIVRLATRDLGVQSAIAKGALKPKSRFGARLQVLSEGVAQLHVRPNRDLHTLSEFDVARQRTVLARDIRRYAGASALAELVMRVAPAEPSPGVYDHIASGLSLLETLAQEDVDAGSLAVLWKMVTLLGFAPSLEECARDGRSLPVGTATFSVADGGLLCSSCARAIEGPVLEASDRAILESLVAGDRSAMPTVSPRHAAAHRRLLARFVRRHLAEESELKALAFWEGLPWNDT